MSRTFRLAPPEPRPDLVMRTRLLRSLAGRWQHRVTAVTGGPGLGKTTVLAQAIAENRLAPRGDDLWIGLEPRDADADSLARVVTAAVERGDEAGGDLHEEASEQVAADPEHVADAVWRRAPTEACLVLDDVHLLEPGTSGAAWLDSLVATLPANGHVVLASRSEPPIRLGRFGTQGELLRVAEDDLRFDDDERSGFARQRGIDPRWLDVTGGWPAMAELIATVDQRLTGSYLWEEVLEPLGSLRRHVLAVLCDFGAADDALVSAALGADVDLAATLDGVPLVARRSDGWHVPHSLWWDAPGLEIDTDERVEMRRRAVDNLLVRHRFDEAFTLVAEAGLWDLAPQVLRAACLAPDRVTSSQLQRWLSKVPDDVEDTVGGRLAQGVHAWFRDPATSTGPLRQAAKAARAADDVDAEVTVVAQLAAVAWWHQDLASLFKLAVRMTQLDATGNPRAHAAATMGRAVAADIAGNRGSVLSELASLPREHLDPAWEVMSIWLAGVVQIERGDLDGVLALVERSRRNITTTHQYVLDSLEIFVAWLRGQVDEVVARIPEVYDQARRHGAGLYLHVGVVFACLACAAAGRTELARRYYDECVATAPPSEDGVPPASVLLALAVLQLAEYDVDGSAATMRLAVERHGLDNPLDRRTWRLVLPLVYLLLPESRPHWDGLKLRGPQARTLEMARAAVQTLEGDLGALRKVEILHPEAVRSTGGFVGAAVLAVGLTMAGRPEGPAVLSAGGPRAREVVRRVAAEPSWPFGAGAAPDLRRRAKAARSLLAAVPAPPSRPTYVGVLGPLVVRRGGRDGEEVVDTDLRRRRVQELLAYLVGHRRTTRPAIADTLWPDLDAKAAANNLGVTINHLLRILEPSRDQGEPSYLLRMDGASVQLVTDEFLHLDVDEFDAHIAAAARAEADGMPSLVLEHDLAAVALYRDTLHLDVVDTGWLDIDREHYRTRFVAAAVRAGQLLLARGDLEKAQTVVYRVLTTDRWSEGAYAVLVGAALARGDRSGAVRLLRRCEEALAELGVTPSPAVDQLRRRVELSPA
jgi:DNA-binding SARP family transcriptional activator